MARRSRSRRRSAVRYVGAPRFRRKTKRFTLPLAAIAGFAPLVVNTITRTKRDGLESGLASISQGLTGYNPQEGKWKASGLMEGLVPIMLGLGVHKLASKFGLNRMIAGAGVPWIRI